MTPQWWFVHDLVQTVDQLDVLLQFLEDGGAPRDDVRRVEGLQRRLMAYVDHLTGPGR